MQKNWYAVYTKPQNEKKVAASLSRKKIENYCPMCCVESHSFLRNKLVSKPLFPSFVFVFADDEQLNQIQRTDGVVNMLYWLGNPAVISDKEIHTIREFVASYPTVYTEKIDVEPGKESGQSTDSTYAIEGKMITIKNTTLKISLPSLGYNLVALVEGESIFHGRETSIVQSDSFVNS